MTTTAVRPKTIPRQPNPYALSYSHTAREHVASKHGPTVKTTLTRDTITVRREGEPKRFEARVEVGNGQLAVFIRDRWVGSVLMADPNSFEQLNGLLDGWMGDPWAETRFRLGATIEEVGRLGIAVKAETLIWLEDWLADPYDGDPYGDRLAVVGDVLLAVFAAKLGFKAWDVVSALESALVELDSTFEQMERRLAGRTPVADDHVRARLILDRLNMLDA